MNPVEAIDASPMNAALNTSGIRRVMVRRYGDDHDSPLETFVQRPDTGEFEHTAYNYAAGARVDTDAWEPVLEWPAGYTP